MPKAIIMGTLAKKSIGTLIVNGFFLAILNVVLMCIIGYLTLDSEANLNSRIGAFLLSFFIPIFIVSKTTNMNNLERMLKFGIGLIVYIVLALFMLNLFDALQTGLIPCLVISLGILFYGNAIVGK